MISKVVATLHSSDGNRGVKIVKRPDGTFGCDEYRRDPEDAGSWTFVKNAAQAIYATQDEAATAARAGWLRDMASPGKERE